MLYFEWVLKEKSDDYIIINSNDFNQKIFFDKNKVKNPQDLEKILSFDLDKSIIVGVYAFSVSYKKEWKCSWFIKYVLTGDLIK